MKRDRISDYYGEVSKKLMPCRNASRTVATASTSATGPKTLPRGEAPKPTELTLRPVFPRGRSSILAWGVDIARKDRHKSGSLSDKTDATGEIDMVEKRIQVDTCSVLDFLYTWCLSSRNYDYTLFDRNYDLVYMV